MYSISDFMKVMERRARLFTLPPSVMLRHSKTSKQKMMPLRSRKQPSSDAKPVDILSLDFTTSRTTRIKLVYL